MGRSTTIFSTVLAALLALLVAAAGPAAATAGPDPDQLSAGEPGRDYAADQVIVRMRGGGERLLELPPGASVEAAAAALRANPRVAYAVPNYVAHAAAANGTSWVPNDPGAGATHGGWQAVQWNFLPCGSACAPGTQPLTFESKGGIDAPGAWAALRARGHAGGAGVKVAVLDTGVAYRNLRPKYAKSPDFARRQFLPGYDFVANDALALDEDGHGTHVAGTIAEQTGNAKGLTGLAYGAKLIPVRVLDQAGEGKARDIAKGIMFAVKHGAKVINMSFEFGGFVQSCKQVKGICRAVRYANRQGTAVVAADGNDTNALAAFPARIPGVIGVGATTEGGCLADYSNYGSGLDLVAPGGRGEGATTCRTADRPISQVTLLPPSLTTFGLPTDYAGTSMSASHVSALAAMVISSGVLGAHPSPLRVQCQLAATARRADLGEPYDVNRFGGGLIDAAAAVTAAAC